MSFVQMSADAITDANRSNPLRYAERNQFKEIVVYITMATNTSAETSVLSSEVAYSQSTVGNFFSGCVRVDSWKDEVPYNRVTFLNHAFFFSTTPFLILIFRPRLFIYRSRLFIHAC
jgi:hypothetical protein